MKPLGLALTIDGGMRVIHPTPVEDAIYEAVEEAQMHGWTVEQFRREAANCWDIYLTERLRLDAQAWKK